MTAATMAMTFFDGAEGLPKDAETPDTGSPVGEETSVDTPVAQSPVGFARVSATKAYEFEVGELLGRGAFATVHKGKLQGCGTPVAVKVIDKSNENASCTIGPDGPRYRTILKSLDHPNVVNYYDIMEEETHAYVVMELCTGGDFFDFMCGLQTFTEADCANWVTQMLKGIQYIHSVGLAHRDVKPENLRWSHPGKGCTLKLVDFGLATTELKERELTKLPVLGTTMYAAPEVLAGRYNMQCDTWGVGVALVLLITGKFPFLFEGGHPVHKGQRYTLDDPAWAPVSPEGHAMVLALLNPDPWTRVTPQQALGRGWTGLVRKVVAAPTAERMASLAQARMQSCMGAGADPKFSEEGTTTDGESNADWFGAYG
mmetsp:Transcript_9467/g.24066  ORF Transcript_9467/g.24066 Transcript_9467/m.24066 type:complete len:371 (-) Transcript_9467:20-1132(-)